MPRESLSPRTIDRILVDQGILSEDQWHIASLERSRTGQAVEKLLVSLGFVSEATLCDALSESLGKSSIDLRQTIVAPAALALVPQALALRHRLMPIAVDPVARLLTVAIADIDDLVAADKLRAQVPAHLEIELQPAAASEIEQAIDRHYGYELSIDGILREIEAAMMPASGIRGPHAATVADGEGGQPVIRLVDAILVDAVKCGASDLHFEPEANFLRIRYRIDGALRQIRTLHKSYWPAMAVRIKVICGMNIAETRAPQDGRINLALHGREIDFRVATQPTIHGENIVLRILDRHQGIVPLNDLGLASDHLAQLKEMIARPQGIILVTGPTGSGKTTTLYSLLNHIRSERINIMTLEDPVEYPMTLVRQTSLSESLKLDFATGIRSMMRQDPDVILVGEIRDPATATMAFRAAMTGHQVYSTLHSNSALGALPRLLDIGIPSDILAGNIIGIVAQRLLRRLCSDCKEVRDADADERKLFGLDAGTPSPPVFVARGCVRCGYQGYRGRLAITELLPIDDNMDDLIARRAPPGELREAARAAGFRSLSDDGLRHVRNGTTSLDEIRRVVGLTRRTGT